MNTSKKGTITYWNGERGFGFVTTTNGARYFFHRTNFKQGQQPVLDGQVEFEIGPGVATGKPAQAVRLRYSGTDAVADEIFTAANGAGGGAA